MSGITMLDGYGGSGRRAQYHGLPASLLAVESVPPAQRSGPEWGEDREHSKRFAELVKRLGDIRHQHRSAF